MVFGLYDLFSRYLILYFQILQEVLDFEFLEKKDILMNCGFGDVVEDVFIGLLVILVDDFLFNLVVVFIQLMKFLGLLVFGIIFSDFKVDIMFFILLGVNVVFFVLDMVIYCIVVYNIYI